MKISKFLLIVFAILLWTVDYGLLTVNAQHEGHQPPAEVKQEAAKKKKVSKKALYYCPMHPSYTSDRPGDCPICNMKLVKNSDSTAGSEEKLQIEKGSSEGFYVSPEKQQLIGVKTDKVRIRPLSKVIRTVGRVAFDPQLYSAQAEYIEAVKTLEKVKESGQESLVTRVKALVEASELKLKLQGLDIKQIEELQKTKQNDTSLLISAPDSQITWVYAVIYEYELELVKIGQETVISAAAYPGKEFNGKITAIDPVFDSMTRSVRARIKADNKGALLKPEMYVDVQFHSDLGDLLSVPKEAILDSGLRKIVFLIKDNGHFQPVEVKAGVSTEEYVQVLEGLKEGDTVVVSGNFLIDAESKLKAAFEGTGHQHGQ